MGADLFPPIVQFDRFELDLRSYELRRSGRRVKLQRVPMELLILLVERQGALVVRDDIVARIWSSDTELDTERSINTAVRKIREALGDDAGRARFVETVVGKGYRFIAPVTIAGRAEPGPAAVAPSVPMDAAPTVAIPPRTWPRVAAVGMVAGGLALAYFGMVLGPAWRAPKALMITPFTALPGSETGPAFSPNGNQVAFAWETGDSKHIYVQKVGGGAPDRLTAAVERDSDPSWSPDGRFLAFLREDAHQRMTVCVMASVGEAERRIHEISRPIHFRPAWSADGKGLAILDSEPPGAPASVFLLSVDSGTMRRLTSPPSASAGDGSPALSPDGRTLVFLRNSGSLGTSHVYLLPVDPTGGATGPARRNPSDRADFNSLEWAADGQSLIGATHAGLVRVPVAGGPAEQLPFRDALEPSVSHQGSRMVYVQSLRDSDIFRVPGPGYSDGVSKLISSTRAEAAPSYSPDGSRIAFISERTGSQQLWMADSEGQHVVQLTSFTRGTVGSPRWSSDSQQIAFDSTQDGRGNIYVIGTEGGTPRQITSGGSSNVRPSWSRYGNWIYFGSDRDGSWDIWKIVPGSAAGVRVTHDGAREGFEDPEGKYLYYAKGQPEKGVWRMAVAGGATERITTEGLQGRWGIGKKGIYYLDDAGQLALVDVDSRSRVPFPTPGLQPIAGLGGGLLGIGPEDRWIVVTTLVRLDSDLTLVENFR